MIPGRGREAARAALLVIAGAAVLAYAAGVTAVSDAFVYGFGHRMRPILAVVGLFALGWAGFAAQGVLAARAEHGPAARRRWPVVWLIAVALGARLLLWPSNLVQENDCYRYALDGMAVLHGVNPFRYAPEDLPEAAPGAFRDSLETEAAQTVLGRVGYPHVPTIYPPAAQGAFALGAAAMPWDWRGQRLVFLAADTAAFGLILLLLHRWGRPLLWAGAYGWNPLVLKEVANAAHVDALAAVFLVGLAGALFARTETETRRARWTVLAAVMWAGAVLTKLYPLLLGPLCLAVLWRRSGTRRAALGHAALFCGVSAALSIAALAPFMGVGPERLTEGLRTYGAEWLRNAGAFLLLDAILPHPRLAAAAIVAAGALGLTGWLLRGPATRDRALAAAAGALLWWFLWLPAVYPWYAIGIAAVAALRPRPWLYVLSGSFGLYYLWFYYTYHDFDGIWFHGTQAVEHGVVWLTLAAGLVATARHRPSTASERSTTS